MKHGLNIYKRKDSRYEGKYKGLDGKRHSVYAKTYTECKEKLIKSLKELSAIFSTTHMTVKEISFEFMQNIATQTKESTHANYQMKLNAHILPCFGEIKYSDLTAEKISTFIADLMSCGRRKGGSLSASYVKDILTLFKSICKFATKKYGVTNISANIEPPKIRKKPLEILGANEYNQLKAALLNSIAEKINPIHIGFLLSLFTGIRLGELAGLTWNDVDFSNRTIRINKTVQRISKSDGNKSFSKIVIQSPKTANSNREIPMSDEIYELLLEIKGEVNTYILSGTEKVVEPRLIQYHFKRFLEKHGLPSVNFHMLRHIFATNMISAGCDPKTLSVLLGHSSVVTTLNLYVHISNESKRKAINLIKFVA